MIDVMKHIQQRFSYQNLSMASYNKINQTKVSSFANCSANDLKRLLNGTKSLPKVNEHHYDGRWWRCNHHKDGYHTLNLRVQRGVGVQVTEKNSFAIEIDYCLLSKWRKKPSWTLATKRSNKVIVKIITFMEVQVDRYVSYIMLHIQISSLFSSIRSNFKHFL